jgi:hypothetical protein
MLADATKTDQVRKPRWRSPHNADAQQVRCPEHERGTLFVKALPGGRQFKIDPATKFPIQDHCPLRNYPAPESVAFDFF